MSVMAASMAPALCIGARAVRVRCVKTSAGRDKTRHLCDKTPSLGDILHAAEAAP